MAAFFFAYNPHFPIQFSSGLETAKRIGKALHSINITYNPLSLLH